MCFVSSTLAAMVMLLWLPTVATASELPVQSASQPPAESTKGKAPDRRQSSPPVAKNLVYNGSFEGFPDFEGTWISVPSPSRNIYGWTVTSGEVALTQSPWGNVPSPIPTP